MEDIPRLIYLGLLIVALGGWLIAQSRLSLNKTLQYAVVWGLIFVGAIAVVGLWDDISRQVTGAQQSTAHGQIEVPRARDGHYYLTLTINDEPVRFVVDTGASQVVLTQKDAARVGLDPSGLAYLGTAMTANGEVRIAPVRLARVDLGGVVDSNLPAAVNGGEMDESLLGMSYLQRWDRIEITGDRLVLTR